MPWKNVSPMEQKQRFVSLAGSGHFTMTELCRDFGVSRKTGHKWVARHAEGGMKALEERSRAPKSVTCRTSDEVERLICTEKRLRSTWGPKKIRQILLTKHGLESPPAISTVGEVLKRHGLVAERRRRGAVFKVERGTLTAPERPNHVLGVDFKGWFLTGDGRRCDPRTVTDLHSRFILKIEGLEEARTSFAALGQWGDAKRIEPRRQGWPVAAALRHEAPLAKFAAPFALLQSSILRTTPQSREAGRDKPAPPDLTFKNMACGPPGPSPEPSLDRCGKLPGKISLHACLLRGRVRRDRPLSGNGRHCLDSYFLLLKSHGGSI